MSLSKAEEQEVLTAARRTNRYVDAPIGAVPRKVWGISIRRGGKNISALQELADAKTLIIKQQATIDSLAAKVNSQAVTK